MSTAKVANQPKGSTEPAAGAIVNPYRSKFVGGAELARKNARKRRSNAIQTPAERKRLKEVLPPNMNPFERFSAALLRTSPSDLVASENDVNKGKAVWKEICSRVELAVPDQSVLSEYNDPRVHFAVRAALVLEEARCAIAQPLKSRWSNIQRNSSRGVVMNLTAHYSERTSNGHCRAKFMKSVPFTKDELFHLRPGSVFQCIPRDSGRNLSDVILGIMMSGGSREQNEYKRDFTLTFFRDIPKRLDGDEFTLSPLTTLISELRCFEAMSINPSRIPFLNDLMGRKRKTHTRFGDSDDSDGQSKPSAKKGTIGGYFQPAVRSDVFSLPSLNSSQRKAEQEFLNSAHSSITLIQGPPGCGKTTLLVSVICRYLLEKKPKKRQLLVCAPTNKAVTVLAQRFMAAMNPKKPKYNALMVGDADKLLAEDRNNKDNLLRPIFIFSWLQSVTDGYRRIRGHFTGRSNGKSRSTTSDMHRLAGQIEHRVSSYLDGVYPELDELAGKVTTALEKIVNGSGDDVVAVLNSLIRQLEDINKEQPDFVWRQLIATANVVFCTLASAGGLVLRNHSVDDLIVDEAAAATEPELCIPLHMRPSRMLCVGDPLQLPATVLSRTAIGLGLSESLHERLMYRCDHKYTMLDIQYRMKPTISQFPSWKFYDSKIKNGDNVESPSYAGMAKLFDGSSYMFLDVANGAEEQGFGGSTRNQAEARCVVEMIKVLREQTGGTYLSAAKLRIITFYQAQVALLKKLLRELGLADRVVIATVDSSQGSEADIVIVSFVRTNNRSPGFLCDNRRLNVSLTRAKYQLVCVGNVRSLLEMNGAPTLQQLAQNAMDRDVVVPFPGSHKKKNEYDELAHLEDFYGN